MMKIHVLSDIHTEIASYRPHTVDVDVIVLAGDIGNGSAGVRWARQAWPNHHIIYVPGNHEFYQQSRIATLNSMRTVAGIYVLDNDEHIFDGVRFLGATLWTDFMLYPSMKMEAQMEGERCLNDFRLINDGEDSEGKSYGAFDTFRSVQLHEQSLEWLKRKLDEPFAGKTIVITHHLPSMRCVPDRFKKSLLSACFASNLDHLFGKMDCWIHGHTHDTVDFTANGTRIIANPRGYSRYGMDVENMNFKPWLVIEI